jgi:hypothetical protein
MQPESQTTPRAASPLPNPNAMPVPVGEATPAIVPLHTALVDPFPDATDPIIDALPEADLNTEDVAWLNVTEIDELAQCVNTCVERWRNAGPDARKKCLLFLPWLEIFSLSVDMGMFLSFVI